MGLTDLFDRWIIERGSALVQEKHIAFIREQLVAADKKIASLDDEIIKLTTENSTLKAENINSDKKQFELHQIIDQLKKDTDTLRAEITTLKNPIQNILLDESAKAVLKLFFRQTKLTSEQVSRSLGIALQMANFHIEILKSMRMLKQCFVPHEIVEQQAFGTIRQTQLLPAWEIDQKGRKYLIDNNLIP